MKIRIKGHIPIFSLILCAFVLAFNLKTAQKQENQKEIQEKAIAINIEVPTRVYDGNKFVDNLTIEDFELYEDRVLQDIDAVYLIKERTIKRKESVDKEEIIKEEDTEKKFAPKEPRHFFLVFELLDYTPQIKEIADYFFQNVIQPEDTLQVITPVKTYRLKAESFKIKTKEDMGKALWSIVKKDVGIGNSEYRNLMEEMKKIVRAMGIFLAAPGANILDAFGNSMYTSDSYDDLKLLLPAYETNLIRLEQIRGVDQKGLMDFGASLEGIEGQKIVFLLYQREYIPQIDLKALPQISDLMQDDPAAYMALQNITGLYARGSCLDVDRVKKAYADASISAHFMFLTKIAETLPGITMQESSSDIFGAFKSLADATGGTVDSSSSPEHLFEKAVEASENYYLLYYTPKNYVADGKFKKIEVRVKGKNYRVTHRAGYIAD